MPYCGNAFTHYIHEAHGLIMRAKVSQAISSSDFHDRALSGLLDYFILNDLSI